MALLNNGTRYGSLSIALHWLMVVLIVLLYAMIELRVYWPKGDPIREGMKSFHFMLGLSVFFLVWLRIAARMFGGKPGIVPPLPVWQSRLSGAAHGLLYLLMVGMPIGGWLILSTAGKPIPFWGFELPALTAPDAALSKQIKSLHETFGTVGYFLIGLHAVAGIYHHYFLKDNTLLRILPRR